MPLKVLDTPIDMAIGTLAERTGVNVPTIRYYEEIGLLPPAHRRPSGHRVYSATQVQLLNFIRRFRDFGFSIDQVRELVALAQNECDDSQEACVLTNKAELTGDARNQAAGQGTSTRLTLGSTTMRATRSGDSITLLSK